MRQAPLAALAAPGLAAAAAAARAERARCRASSLIKQAAPKAGINRRPWSRTAQTRACDEALVLMPSSTCGIGCLIAAWVRSLYSKTVSGFRRMHRALSFEDLACSTSEWQPKSIKKTLTRGTNKRNAARAALAPFAMLALHAAGCLALRMENYPGMWCGLCLKASLYEGR